MDTSFNLAKAREAGIENDAFEVVSEGGFILKKAGFGIGDIVSRTELLARGVSITLMTTSRILKPAPENRGEEQFPPDEVEAVKAAVVEGDEAATAKNLLNLIREGKNSPLAANGPWRFRSFKEPKLRQLATQKLPRTSEVFSVLTEGLDDSDNYVRAACIEALSETDPLELSGLGAERLARYARLQSMPEGFRGACLSSWAMVVELCPRALQLVRELSPSLPAAAAADAEWSLIRRLSQQKRKPSTAAKGVAA